MKKLILLYLCALSLASFAQTTITKNLVSSGITREYRIYIPALYDGTKAVPVVFNFHGYTSNNLAQEFYADFRPVADTANFIVVHPQGTVIGGGNAWNNFDLATTPDDVAFVSDMIDSLKANYNIDLNRVYSTGLSNGGFMSYDLACKLNNRIAAIASVSGSMIASHFNACNVLRPTPIMQIHGDIDAVVTYNGTGGIIGSIHIDTLIKKWVTQNNCNPTPIYTPVPNINTTDGCVAEHYEYINGGNGSTVELFKIIGGGHTWPGTSIMVPSNGNTNLDFSASREIWRFFSKFSLANLSTSASTWDAEEKVIFYPNPTSDMLYVAKTIDKPIQITLQNTLGQLVMNQTLQANENAISISGLPAGVYCIRFQENGKTAQLSKLLVK
jgi:polyhydroxybutyrate depolymerase